MIVTIEEYCQQGTTLCQCIYIHKLYDPVIDWWYHDFN